MSTAGKPDLRSARLLTVAIGSEQDVVTARQRARQVAELAGFDKQNQIRIATAVSEIARNAWQYGNGGKIEFSIDRDNSFPGLAVQVSDRGPGIAHLQDVLDGQYQSETGMGIGMAGARRLMDEFEVHSDRSGTVVRMLKRLRRPAVHPHPAAMAAQLASVAPPPITAELWSQNHELVRTLEELRQRETELRHLNQELEDTNRGVMALYAELDDKAVSLKRADELKSRFLSHVSHEFRTPLNSIRALTGLLLSRADGDLVAEQEKQIAFIRKAAEDLSEMVNDLLDLAKMEAGKTEVHSSEFPVSVVFGALRAMMRPVHTNELVELTIEDPVPEIVLNTDETKVAQILRNLVSNALKFTEQGSVSAGAACTPSGVEFTVSDTGVGIPPEEHDRIFEEFVQVESRLQRKLKGTGLGLSLSRRLAQLLGGSLTVESTPGLGSTFCFRLPASAIAKPGSGDMPDAGLSDASVLVIDDDEVTRYLVRQMLKGTVLSVSEAENGVLGLERARFENPAAILLDLSMPGLSGFEVLDILRQQPETSGTPVIVFTSRSLSDGERARLKGRTSAIISKRDVNTEDFTAVIEKILGGSIRTQENK